MINLNLFSQRRPFLYHLTSELNLPVIASSRSLVSTSVLLGQSDDALTQLKKRRRSEHLFVEVDGHRVMIRDQLPLSEKALSKCLDDGLTSEDYCELLNQRVFCWATLSRLSRHFDRYASEEPALLRFSTEEILRLNANVDFCRINSGATRANSHLGGIAPRRGYETFLSAERYPHGISSVVEVTFVERCTLPERIELASNPDGPWSVI
jgi:hypothetical protein